jgi:hypothetical protein
VSATFRFRPRYRGVAIASILTGGSLSGIALVVGAAALPIVTGAIGLAAGAAYLMSPVWRISVTLDDEGITVGSPGQLRFRLAWGSVVQVIASPSTHTLFVDGGSPQQSLLVPGPGAPAPYDIERKPELYAAIIAHLPEDKVRIVESLEVEKKRRLKA